MPKKDLISCNFIVKLILDIETIGEDFNALDKTTQEVLTRWIDDKEDLENLKQELGFSPLTGEIVAIGVLDYETDKGVVYFQAPGEKIEQTKTKNFKFKPETEKQMLEKFWQGVTSYQELITFNGRGFDVPFIMVRSAIHKIEPTVNFMPYRYANNTNHVDLLDQLTFYGAVRKKGNLHLWCRAFGIKSPKSEGVTGDDVAQLFKEKKYLEIAKYNVRDLQATKELYDYWAKYIKIN